MGGNSLRACLWVSFDRRLASERLTDLICEKLKNYANEALSQRDLARSGLSLPVAQRENDLKDIPKSHFISSL